MADSKERPIRTTTPGRAVTSVVIFLSTVAIIGSVATPNLLTTGPGLANEFAAIATLRNVWDAQQRCQASGSIDCDGDGVGEYGYFAELAGGIALRSGAESEEIVRLSPPVLSGAFANVATQSGITGGVVTRSGYLFQMYLPDASGRGLPEADMGGAPKTDADPDRSESCWGCYAWPSSYRENNRRVFFINQDGDVLVSDNEERRYSGASRVPRFDAAFGKGSLKGLASRTANGRPSSDGQTWHLLY